MENLLWLNTDIKIIESFKTTSVPFAFSTTAVPEAIWKEGRLVTVLDLVNPFYLLAEMVQIQMVIVSKVIQVCNCFTLFFVK